MYSQSILDIPEAVRADVTGQFVASLSQKGYSGAFHQWFLADELAERLGGQFGSPAGDWMPWVNDYLGLKVEFGEMAYDPGADRYRLRG
jgi:hypothetical protein